MVFGASCFEPLRNDPPFRKCRERMGHPERIINGAGIGTRPFLSRPQFMTGDQEVFLAEGMAILDTVTVVPFISPVSLTVCPACFIKSASS